MYMRSYRREEAERVYAPPPGYAGHAIARESAWPEPEMKHHVPQEVPREEKSREDRPAPEPGPDEKPMAEPSPLLPLTDLFENLRGKIGTEEWLLLLVMLLTAADGIGVEVWILALVLLAG